MKSSISYFRLLISLYELLVQNRDAIFLIKIISDKVNLTCVPVSRMFAPGARLDLSKNTLLLFESGIGSLQSHGWGKAHETERSQF